MQKTSSLQQDSAKLWGDRRQGARASCPERDAQFQTARQRLQDLREAAYLSGKPVVMLEADICEQGKSRRIEASASPGGMLQVVDAGTRHQLPWLAGLTFLNQLLGDQWILALNTAPKTAAITSSSDARIAGIALTPLCSLLNAQQRCRLMAVQGISLELSKEGELSFRPYIGKTRSYQLQAPSEQFAAMLMLEKLLGDNWQSALEMAIAAAIAKQSAQAKRTEEAILLSQRLRQGLNQAPRFATVLNRRETSLGKGGKDPFGL